MIEDLLHHGVHFSYYSAKTRAYLSYKRIPFQESYNAADLSTRIQSVTHKIMIPVVEIPDGELLQDTTVIIDELERRYPERPIMPDDPVLLLLSRIVEFTIDEFWIITAMNTRWNDPVSCEFAVTEFGRGIGGSMGLQGEEALNVGKQVAARMQSFLPFLGIDQVESQKATNQFFEEASLLLDRAVSATQFSLGKRPCLMDFCLYTAYYAHQYRDAGQAQQFLKTNAHNLCYFIDNMTTAHTAPVVGDLALTEELKAYLAYVCKPAAVFAMNTAIAAEQAAVGKTAGELFEQRVGPVAIEFNGTGFNRGSSTFSAWKLQRVKDVFSTMDANTQARALKVAGEIGWRSLLERASWLRLQRLGHQIHLA